MHHPVMAAMGNVSSSIPLKDNSEPANADRNVAQARTPSRPTSSSSLLQGQGALRAASPDDIPLTRDNLLFLQRTIGNRAVVQLLQRKGEISQLVDAGVSEGISPNHEATPKAESGRQELQRLLQSGGVRAKLEVGGADDPAEHEADRMAESAMQGGNSCTCSPDAPPCPRCHAAQGVVRRKPSSSGISASADNLSLGAARPLADAERSFFETRFNADLSDVRVHDNEQAASSAAQINARAFTLGSEIAFGRDEYNTHTDEGQFLLAHELAHVLQQARSASPQTIRRVGAADPPFGYAPGERELIVRERQRERQEEAERERRHEAWVGSVNQRWIRDLDNQSRTIGEERERIELALTAQRAAAMDAVASGQGWLSEALRNQGYSGPGLAEVKQSWAEALVAAELLKLGSSRGDLTPDARLAGLQAVPTFYNALGAFARAAEEAHQTHMRTENDRLQARYQAELAEHERAKRIDRETARSFAGELGGRAAAGGMAMSRELLRPNAPTYLTAPPSISGQIDAASARVYAAETDPDWSAVASDVNRLGNGLATLVVASLPTQSGKPGADIRTGVEYLEQLDTRLEGLEKTNPIAERIPAVFYPEDRTISRAGEGGETQLAPEGIPWQFYLINTGVTSHDQPAHSGGEWVLIDLTSGQPFENRAPASDFDSAMLAEGAAVDPPIDMFAELNSRIRFPKGRLSFKLPKEKWHYLETTEPLSLSDWLSAIGMTLAAIALVAVTVATGGVAGAGAVAFYAGLGATAASIGSSLASLHEKSQQGILTSAAVDEAMISIGIDIITAGSMGLGRLVAAPRAAARLGFTGERLIALQRLTQVARAGALAGDVYQVYSLTSGLVSAFNAIENQPGLSEEERKRMRAQLVRRALISGALLTIAIRGDIQDYQAGRTLRVSHVDPDGALVPARPDADAPSQHADAPGASTAAHAAPHADVTGPVHADSGRIGTGLTVGPQSHAVAAAGTKQRRDFYFCSDLCAPIVQRLEAVVAVLPRNHPFRPAIQDMLSSARKASQRLKLGQLTQEEADAVARGLSDRIGRLSNDSQHFAALMNTDPALLAAHGPAIRQRLRDTLEGQTVHLATQGERQAANRGSNRGRDPLAEPDTRSPIETDVLGGFNMQDVARPSRRQQIFRFDVGIFSHTHAEALVPGLPRGLSKEVTIVLPGGDIGRADRVRFIHDPVHGDIIGAHVFEIKPNLAGQIAQGNEQVQRYVAGLRAKIEGDLREARRAVPTTAPDGGPLYRGEVLTYDRDQMRAVLRALRGNPRDAARLAEYEAIARQVFGAAP
ncbi:MAG: DUF4157 domain-containing protein [Blastocatellia bacterium]